MEFLKTWNEALVPIAGYLFIGLAVLLLAALVFAVITFSRYNALRRQMKTFMQGKDAASLEDTLTAVLEDNRRVKVQLKNNMDEIVKINENLLSAYRKIGVVKYNAFPGMAGKVSSSICLLNNENNGVIINSIHGKDGCYTYVREIMNGTSISALTKEDEEALKSALQMEL